MEPGLTDWTNLDTIGAFYPFQGFEWLLVAGAVCFWVWWHYRCIVDEDREMREAADYYRRCGIARCISADGKPRRPSETV
ncbi:hypothetical protein ACFFTN_05570 [Aminobacter aganoensis]|uniref:Uncharacterized protein n=1 Tax=Aminobacter aganoensis TaxID=83264 RepID=A0A7X0F4Y6_9HYPH|nr:MULTISPECIES: hypothetical protein [Aminobacter]KQU65752.1 hypothetical protein ASC75_11115 [Aminobacter sp. DSM 101952]MBB6353194.1 hypothetical protein [Aminobacter aganoensis]